MDRPPYSDVFVALLNALSSVRATREAIVHSGRDYLYMAAARQSLNVAEVQLGSLIIKRHLPEPPVIVPLTAQLQEVCEALTAGTVQSATATNGQLRRLSDVNRKLRKLVAAL